MALYVNTNVTSLNGQRYLSNVQNNLNTTYQRLSSGLRINSAKDDAAGLQIADRMTSQINGLTQGNRNSSDGVALAQTIEGGLDEITNMLQSVRTLAVQAANGTNTDDDRVSLRDQANAYAAEITRIATQTKFGGKTVLNGYQTNGSSIYGSGANANSTGKITFQVGANQGDTVSLDVANFTLSGIANKAGVGSTAATKLTGFSKTKFVMSTAADAQALITSIDSMLKVVDSQRGNLGAIQNRLESTIRNQSNVASNQTDARSRIQDADFAQESANLSQQSIIQQAASSMLVQANSRPQLALSLLG